MIMILAKMSEPIEILFRVLTRAGRRNHVLDESTHVHLEK